MNLIISPAKADDVGRIASMSARLIEAGLPPSWTAGRVEKHIGNRDTVAIVARHTGRLAGFAIMRFREDNAHLNLLAVETEYQRSGIGRELIGWLEESAVVAGTFLVSLEARADNPGALSFYSALGYHETGVIPNYYDGRIDAAHMARDLRVRPGVSDSLFQ
jgi:ribosomal-protein-alanine N-acetyltransferase